MIQLAYVSSTDRSFTPAEIAELLIKSRESNQRQGITGILLYKNGNVLQILEGDPTAVRSLFIRIGADPRHHGVIRLYEKRIEIRDFPDWTMAFKDLDSPDVAALEGRSDLLSPSLDLTRLKATQAMALVTLFREKR